jgi:hypothetical protein
LRLAICFRLSIAFVTTRTKGGETDEKTLEQRGALERSFFMEWLEKSDEGRAR